MSVSFFDPSDTLLGTFDNVVDGVSSYDFLGFSFNTTTQELFGFFDVGEDAGNIGEFFLIGTLGSGLDFVGAGGLGVVDSDSGTIIVTEVSEVIESVPEPSSLIGLGLMGFALLGAKRKAS